MPRRRINVVGRGEHWLQSRKSRRSGVSRSSAYQARALVVELPAWDEELHGRRIVAPGGANGAVEPVCVFHFRHIELDAEARLFGHFQFTVYDSQGFFREPLPV